MTDFVVSAVKTQRNAPLSKRKLSGFRWPIRNALHKALLSPPLPAPALERAFARRSKLLRAE